MRRSVERGPDGSVSMERLSSSEMELGSEMSRNIMLLIEWLGMYPFEIQIFCYEKCLLKGSLDTSAREFDLS